MEISTFRAREEFDSFWCELTASWTGYYWRGKAVDLDRTVSANRLPKVHGFGLPALARDVEAAKRLFRDALLNRLTQRRLCQLFWMPDVVDWRACAFCERVAQFGHEACCKACAGSRGAQHDEECDHLLWKPGANGQVLRGMAVPACSDGAYWEAFYTLVDGSRKTWYWDACAGRHLLPWQPPAGWEVAYDPEGHRFWRSSEGEWFYEIF